MKVRVLRGKVNESVVVVDVFLCAVTERPARAAYFGGVIRRLATSAAWSEWGRCRFPSAMKMVSRIGGCKMKLPNGPLAAELFAVSHVAK